MSNKKVSKAQQAKVEKTAGIRAKISAAQSVVLIDYRGFTVIDDTALRREFRKAGVDYKVLKNTLVRRALNDLGIKELDALLNGPTAVAFGESDLIAPARIIADSIKKTNKMSIKGGLINGKPATADEINVLAAIPSKEVLIAQLLAMLTTPVRRLTVALDQIAQKG
jgi:large subunit ribosomal protein L10